MHKAGIVHQIDNEKHLARVIFPELDNTVSDWLQVGIPFMKAGKSNPMPKEGEQVLCLMDENLEDGYILCSLYSDEDLTPLASDDIFIHEFEDGTKISYDKALHVLTADVAGTVNITAEIAINLTAPTVNIVGNQVISGTSTASDHISDGKSGKSHKHIAPPDGGLTGEPQ